MTSCRPKLANYQFKTNIKKVSKYQVIFLLFE